MSLEEIIVLRLLDQEVFYSHFIIYPLPELTVYPKPLRFWRAAKTRESRA